MLHIFSRNSSGQHILYTHTSLHIHMRYHGNQKVQSLTACSNEDGLIVVNELELITGYTWVSTKSQVKEIGCTKLEYG